MGIFVETLIHAPIEKLWQHTQDPALHQRWDARFTRIEYLPKASADEPQRFRYTRRILPGLDVRGDGETIADRSMPGGARASSIRFGSPDWWSLIREGTGYWRYGLTPEGIRFATWYDYRSRWGRLGRVIDRAVFRPLMGWATAWSFDRLRIWLERDIPPTTTLRAALIHAGARLGLASVFLFHGLVPKLLWPDPHELAMLASAGVPAASTSAALVGMGVIELGLAAVLVLFWHRSWPVLASLAFAAAATLGVALGSPDALRSAFNPAIVNIAVAALALIDLVDLPDAPDAGRCRRQPAERER
jgi:hypothetical protein